MDLDSISENLLCEKGSKWVACFILSYQIDESDIGECECLLGELLPNKEFERYLVDDYIHFLFRGSRVHITQSDHFSFRGIRPEIREIKTEADWRALRYKLNKLSREVIPEEVIGSKKTIWTIDPLEFEFNKADEPLLEQRIKIFNTLLDDFRSKPPTSGDVIVAVMPGQRKKRPRIVLVKK